MCKNINYEDVVRLLNPVQVYFYLSRGVHPLRLECGYNNRIVYVFEKRPTLELYGEWKRAKHEESKA